MTAWQIVADVGGTNTRIAASDRPGHVSAVHAYPTGEAADFCATLAKWLDDTGLARELPSCAGIHIAAAGPVENGTITLTNANLRIDAEAVSRNLGGVRCRIVNDLVAVAMLLPYLDTHDYRALPQPDHSFPAGPRIAVNVGTGFGASTCLPVSQGRWLAASSEAGHMALAAASAEELLLLETAESLEGVLSGGGVLSLYDRIAARESNAHAAAPRQRPADAASVFAAVQHDGSAALATEMITKLLGRVVGDLVLACGAWGGAFLCGSVVHGWSGVADLKAFRAAFERKGAMSDRMRGVPTAVITNPNPALIGLSYAASFAAD